MEKYGLDRLEGEAARPLSDFLDESKLERVLEQLKEEARSLSARGIRTEVYKNGIALDSRTSLGHAVFSGEVGPARVKVMILFPLSGLAGLHTEKIENDLLVTKKDFEKVIERLSKAEFLKVVCLDSESGEKELTACRIIEPAGEVKVTLLAILSERSALASSHEMGISFSPARVRDLTTGTEDEVPFHVIIVENLADEEFRDRHEILVTSREELKRYLPKVREEKEAAELAREESLFQITVQRGTELELAEKEVHRAIKEGFRRLKEGQAESVRIEVGPRRTEVIISVGPREKKKKGHSR